MVPRPDSTRLLVVDDERAIADSLAVILTRAGFEVAVAYNGDEAIATARRFGPDIVLSDYAMPGLNGIEMSVRIKRMFPGCRFILLSAHALAEPFEPHKLKGFDFLLLSKPMHPVELLRVMQAEQIKPEELTRQLRVLNVDDVEEHRYSVSRLLTRAGFEVSEAATGGDALREALQSRPDIILLDIHLPDLDGFDVCERLKQNPETARITVMHLTNSANDEESAARSKEVGADEYVTYPVAPVTLLKRIRELLQVRYLEEGP